MGTKCFVLKGNSSLRVQNIMKNVFTMWHELYIYICVYKCIYVHVYKNKLCRRYPFVTKNLGKEAIALISLDIAFNL